MQIEKQILTVDTHDVELFWVGRFRTGKKFLKVFTKLTIVLRFYYGKTIVENSLRDAVVVLLFETLNKNILQIYEVKILLEKLTRHKSCL